MSTFDDDAFMTFLKEEWKAGQPYTKTDDKDDKLAHVYVHMSPDPWIEFDQGFICFGQHPVLNLFQLPCTPSLDNPATEVWVLRSAFGYNVLYLHWNHRKQQFVYEAGRFDGVLEKGTDINIEELLPLWERFYQQRTTNKADQEVKDQKDQKEKKHAEQPAEEQVVNEFDRAKQEKRFLSKLRERLDNLGRYRLVVPLKEEENAGEEESKKRKFGDAKCKTASDEVWFTRIRQHFTEQAPYYPAVSLERELNMLLGKMVFSSRSENNPLQSKQLTNINHIQYHIASCDKIQPRKWEYELQLQFVLSDEVKDQDGKQDKDDECEQVKRRRIEDVPSRSE